MGIHFCFVIKPVSHKRKSKAVFNVFFCTCCCSKFVVVTCYRSSQRGCSVKKGFLINFSKFTGKHLCQSLFFNKVAGISPATLLKKRLWHRCFSVNFAKFLWTPFLQNTSGWLLLLLLVVSTSFIPMISVLSSILEELLHCASNTKLKLNIVRNGLVWTVRSSRSQMFF